MEQATVLWIPGLVSLVAASVAAETDLREFRVRNVLTVPLIATGLLYHALFTGSNGFASSLWGLLFGLAVLIPPWLAGLMGAGDAKLMGGIGAWLGLGGALAAMVVTSLATGLVAVCLIIYRGRFRESIRMTKMFLFSLIVLRSAAGNEDILKDLSQRHDRRLRVIPFAAMVPVGVLGSLIWMAMG